MSEFSQAVRELIELHGYSAVSSEVAQYAPRRTRKERPASSQVTERMIEVETLQYPVDKQTIQSVADKYGVSTHTIRRDLDFFSRVEFAPVSLARWERRKSERLAQQGKSK